MRDQLDGEEKKTADRLLETLERWGIRNLHALAALPQVALSERLGQEGLRLQQLARGGAARTLVPVEAPLVFEEAIELEHPIVLLEPLAFLLNRLLEQLCARLSSRALATQELRLTLELSNLTGIDDGFEDLGIASESDEASKNMWGQPPSAVRRSEAPVPPRPQTKFIRKLNLPLPMLDAKVFLKLLQLDLNAHPPGAPIMKIHLAAEPARPRWAQGGLFLPPSPEPEKLELTLARIAGMVGEHKVGALELLDTHHPEGFRMRRFVAEVAQKSSAEKNSGFVSIGFRGHRPAPLPSPAARECDAGKRPARASGLSEKRSPGRSPLEGRPLALLRRLVGARSLVARRVGPRPAQRRCHLLLPPGARPARRWMVCGRNI